jgi:hypothetical protein
MTPSSRNENDLGWRADLAECAINFSLTIIGVFGLKHCQGFVSDMRERLTALRPYIRLALFLTQRHKHEVSNAKPATSGHNLTRDAQEAISQLSSVCQTSRCRRVPFLQDSHRQPRYQRVIVSCDQLGFGRR